MATTTRATTKTSSYLLLLMFAGGYLVDGIACKSVGQAVVEWHYAIAFFAFVVVDWLRAEAADRG